MAGYVGPYCIESFDPRVLLWYRRHQPDVIRGQLAEVFTGAASGNALVDKLLQNLVFCAVTWPDFIAYNHVSADKRALRFWQRVLGCTLAAWTITSEAQLAAARRRFSVFIFDSFTPTPF
jgi:hypothetical protein